MEAVESSSTTGGNVGIEEDMKDLGTADSNTSKATPVVLGDFCDQEHVDSIGHVTAESACLSKGISSRGEYFSKNQYFFTSTKNGPARDSRDTLSLDSNISARTPKKAIFLHIVVIYLHGPKKKAYFYAQLNKKLAKSTLYHIIPCFAFFSMI